jgi:prepilin signal peptidase PulO-like enzyme (type II secretory pathway)
MTSSLIWSPFVFLFGAAIGSFLNVVILRWVSGQSIAGRSHCPHCRRMLSWYDLIPLLSFTFFRGRCRTCYNPISWQYPVVELLSGVGAVLLFQSVTHTVIFWLLIILFFIDFKAFILPDFFIVLLTAVIVLSVPVSQAGMMAGAGFLLFLWLATGGQGIGFGDVKLMIPLGLLFGLAGTLMLLATAFIIGGTIGMYLLITKQATRKTAIPFGPYLTGVAMVQLVFPEVAARVQSFLIPGATL